MRQTLRLCDLPHDGIAEAVDEVQVLIDQSRRTLDVCSDHLAILSQLPLAGEAPSSSDRPVEVSRRAEPADAAEPASATPRRRNAHPRSSEPRRSATQAGRLPGSRRALQEERAAVREWARAQGRAVGDKGRLPAGLVDEYRQASAG
ncbi:Lsr2 family DNA-binding protein [Geodermatophilus sp. SYSU D00700]